MVCPECKSEEIEVMRGEMGHVITCHHCGREFEISYSKPVSNEDD